MTRRIITQLAACCAVALAAPVWHAPAVSAAPAATRSASWPSAGDRGDHVRRLQQALIVAGVGVAGGVDGLFGTATGRSLRTYQQALGLPVSGELDEVSVTSLGLALPGIGDTGAGVARLQKLLIAAKVDVPGGADGVYGAATAKAVATFQASVGKEPTGALDHPTAYRLGFVPQPRAVGAARAAAQSATRAAPAPAPVSIDVFPVQGHCGYQPSWLDARPAGRRHLGVDIIAPKGNYVYAVIDGVISDRLWDFAGRISGNALKLSALDGSNTYFYYGHLYDFVPGMKKGARVKAGQIIGFIGDTGLAGTSHLHFEVHPGGGPAVNPYPVVRAVDACDVTAPGPNAYG